MSNEKYYSQIIDIMSDHDIKKVFSDVGKLLAKSDPQLFITLFEHSFMSGHVQMYITMLNEVGKLKTIKAYRENTGKGLRESKECIDRLIVSIDWMP